MKTTRLYRNLDVEMAIAIDMWTSNNKKMFYVCPNTFCRWFMGIAELHIKVLY